MKNAVGRFFEKLYRGNSGMDANLRQLVRANCIVQMQEHRLELLQSPRYSDERRLPRHGYRVYSQGDEDGILHEIFRRIGTTGRNFIELGVGNGLENNTLFLLIQGWRGWWIDSSPRKVASAKADFAPLIAEGRLAVIEHFVTLTNIDAKIKSFVPSPEVDLLSVDLDGNDYHVLRAIRCISPRVIVAEYNAKFPADISWVMQYNERHHWDSSDYFGASLKSLECAMQERGYALVGCNLVGTNAFFVRNDLVADPPFCAPFTAENHYEPPRYFLLAGLQSGHRPGFGPYEQGIPPVIPS